MEKSHASARPEEIPGDPDISGTAPTTGEVSGARVRTTGVRGLGRKQEARFLQLRGNRSELADSGADYVANGVVADNPVTLRCNALHMCPRTTLAGFTPVPVWFVERLLFLVVSGCLSSTRRKHSGFWRKMCGEFVAKMPSPRDASNA